MENTAIDYKKLYEQSLLTISEKEEKIASLSFELDKFRKYIFGKKSEKFTAPKAGEGQIYLFELGTTQVQQEELSEQASIEKPAVKQPKKRAKGSGRMVLPENLRRELITLVPTEDISDCKVIGEEVTEVLELTPAEFYVKRYVRPKYARPNGEGIIIADLPDRVIEKGIPSETVV
jgi:hypothetical protein